MPCAVNYAESKGAVLTTAIYHVIILYSIADKITFLGGKYEKTRYKKINILYINNILNWCSSKYICI